MKGAVYFVVLIAFFVIIECKKAKEKKKCITSDDLKKSTDELKEYINGKFADLKKGNIESAYDCTDIKRQENVDESGLFTVNQHNTCGPLQVFCDMETDKGGWTVIQRRQDGSVDFFRGWDDYVQGFGEPGGEYWMGLEAIYQMTSNGRYEIRFDLESFEGENRSAQYSSFYIGGPETEYTLHVGEYIGGDAGDSFTYQNLMKFTTKDHDNDKYSKNCAKDFTGAWWYMSCHKSNLNGVYYNNDNSGKSEIYAQHVDWYTWLGYHESLKKTEMKIRKRC